MTVDVRLLAGPDAFLAEAGPLLLEDEARHNLILGVTSTIRDSPGRYAERSFWVVKDGGDPVAAALRTPPYNLIVAKPRDAAALEALAAGIEEDIPGVGGARPEVEEFARIWAARRGLNTRVDRRMGVYALRRVEGVRPASGAPRDAIPVDK
jgi:hypothetical protein